MSPRCEDCRFWDNSTQSGTAEPDTTGLCRRNAPVVDILRPSDGLWPFTSDTDWCGAFVAADQPNPF